MTQQNYSTTIVVDRTPQEAFDAITDVRGWWSEEVTGTTDQAGGEFEYHYQDVHRCKVRITELVPAVKVAWLILDNHFNFVQDQSEWTGTQVVFDISAVGSGTQIQFTHVGLISRHECYDVCANAWGGYISGSLKDLINSGKGQPNPKEDGAAPAHQATATAHRAQRPSEPATPPSEATPAREAS